jgi:hypothetical protein
MEGMLGQVEPPQYPKAASCSQDERPLRTVSIFLFLLDGSAHGCSGLSASAWRTQWKNPTKKLIPRKASYALNLANALMYLHERQIIFRDQAAEHWLSER